MKKLLFALFFSFFILMSGCDKVSQIPAFEIYRFDGISAFATTVQPTINEKKVECDCGGTGKVSTDGKINLPCQCGTNCKCQKDKVNNTVDKLTRQALYFGGKHCSPCQKIKKNTFSDMKKKGWVIGPNDNCHIIEMDESKCPNYNVEAIPTFIYLVNGKEVGRSSGYISSIDLANAINGLK